MFILKRYIPIIIIGNSHHRENKEIKTHSQPTYGAGERTEIRILPQIPYALPERSSQSRWNEGRRDYRHSRIREDCRIQLGETVRKDDITAPQEKGLRGPKPLMTSADTAKVKEAVGKHRESIKTAKAAWQEDTERVVSDSTFRRFLESLAQDINV